MLTTLRILILEDSSYDAELEIAVLEKAGYHCEWERVKNRADFLASLDATGYDLILADYNLPTFDGLTALKLFLELDLDLPFILVSGTLGEERAIESLKAGATDYVMKTRLSRLGPVVERALREQEKQRQHKQTKEEIRSRNRELAMLNQIIAASAAGLPPEEILEIACRELALTFKVPQATATLLNEQKSEATIIAEYLAGERSTVRENSIPLQGNPAFQYMLAHKGPLKIDAAQNDPRLASIHDLMRQRGTASLLVLPLLINEEIVGGIGLATGEPHYFSTKDVNLAWSVIDQVAGAVARSRLAQTHRRLITAIEQTTESVIITDIEGTIIYANPTFERVTGYSQAETIGQNPNILKSGKQEPAFYEDLWATISAGRVWCGQFINKKKDGTFYTETATITPVLDENSAIVNYVAVKRDVTRELQLEEQYSQVISSISDHIYMTEITEDGRKENRYLSPNIETLTGYPLESFSDDWSFWSSTVIHPDDRAAAAEQAERLTSGQNSETEYRLVQANGNIIWVRDSGRVEVKNDSITVYGVVSDITERKQTERLLGQRAVQLGLINDIGRQIVTVTELDALLNRAARLVQKMFNYHHVALFLVEGELLKLQAVAGLYLPYFPPGHTQKLSEGINGWVAGHGKKIVANDVAAEPRYTSLIAEHSETRAELCLPLQIAGKTVGVLDIQSQQLNAFTDNDIVAMEALSSQITVAIENTRLYDAVRQELAERQETEEKLKIWTHQQSIIVKLGQSALSSANLSNLLGEVTATVAQTLAVEYCKVLKLLPGGKALLLQAGVGWQKGLVGQARVKAGKDSQAGYTLLSDKPVIVEDLQTETRFRGPQLLLDHQVVSGISVTIQGEVDGQPFGVLGAHTRQQRAFSNNDLRFLQTVANLLAQAIERQQARQALENEKVLLVRRVKERTTELSLINAELMRATRLKDEFLANMSHELRTPLNAVLGMSEVLKLNVYGSLNDEQLNSVNLIEESGRHLLELISDILDLSKIEAGKLALEMGAVEVDLLCTISLQFIKQLAQKKQINIFSKIDQAVDVLQADQRRLKQILVNLLTNAVKFTPEGGEVGLEIAGDRAEGVVRFLVWDTGIGIPENEMEHLFKPFVQLDSSLSRQHEGTGLGLALVSQLVQLHDGGISVESKVGQGTRFTISLPWQPIVSNQLSVINEQRPNKDEFREKDKTKSTPSSANHDLLVTDDRTQVTILLAEDNENNIITMRAFLQTKGYRVIVARNGLEAIERVKEEKPDVILMDIQMPALDGLEATRRIKADVDPATGRKTSLADTPIITLTALAMPGDREMCLKAGANEYLSKPVSLPGLLMVIEKQLQKAS